MNDLAFTNAASNQLLVITCGDDRTIKVGFDLVVKMLLVIGKAVFIPDFLLL